MRGSTHGARTEHARTPAASPVAELPWLPPGCGLQVDKALDERTIGHNPERLNLMKVSHTAWGSAGKPDPELATPRLSRGGHDHDTCNTCHVA